MSTLVLLTGVVMIAGAVVWLYSHQKSDGKLSAWIILLGLGLILGSIIFAPGDSASIAIDEVAEEFGISTEFVRITASNCTTMSRISCQAWESEYMILSSSGSRLFIGRVRSDIGSAYLEAHPTTNEINEVRAELDLPPLEE